MKCPKCGMNMEAICHGQTEVVAFHICFDCRIIEEEKGAIAIPYAREVENSLQRLVQKGYATVLVINNKDHYGLTRKGLEYIERLQRMEK